METKPPIVYALAGAIAVLLVVVVMLAVAWMRPAEAPSAATTTSATAQPAKVSIEDKCGDLAQSAASDLPDAVQKYCDGEWLYTEQKLAERSMAHHWVDEQWVPYEPQRQIGDNFSCYDRSALVADGVPAPMIDRIWLCEYGDPKQDPARGEFSWMGPGVGCDGRWILIVESVLVGSGDPAPVVIGDAVDRWPGASVTPGSACSSMRSTHEGKDVYAIYYDAGHSVSTVCDLKARYGGNARSMNTVGDFSDPC